jgi:predicted transcriptional regulator
MITVRLAPDEMAQLDELAQRESRSKSNMARILILKGIKQFLKESSSESPA